MIIQTKAPQNEMSCLTTSTELQSNSTVVYEQIVFIKSIKRFSDYKKKAYCYIKKKIMQFSLGARVEL